MKNRNLMNSYLYEAWKKAGLNDEDAKQAAIESASTYVAIDALNQAMTKLNAHVDASMAKLNARVDVSAASLRREMTELRAHVDTNFERLRADIIENANRNSRSNLTIMLGAIAVAVAMITLL